jgi:glycerophosphoryl diester phosphodiesterase
MSFNLQGHRGARGLRPENTLPSFEAALDAGVTSIETDLHLTREGVVVLCHDPVVGDSRELVRSVVLPELRRYRMDHNPDRARFPDQDPTVTPLAARFASQHGFDAYAIPTLAELFAFTAAYTGELGQQVGKSEAQRARAARVRFDLELKRVPFHPEVIGDTFTGEVPALLERRVLEAVLAAGVVDRTAVRSFDHRSVRLLCEMEPRLVGGVLISGTAPIAPANLAWWARARQYLPEYHFLDRALVKQAQAEGAQVVPWTVNHPDHWHTLLDWGVDGLTTDFPDRLARELRTRGIDF